MIICSCSYEYGLIYPFKEISTAVPIWPFYFRPDLARLVMSLQIQKNCRLYQSSFQPRCRLFFSSHRGNWGIGGFTVASHNLKKNPWVFPGHGYMPQNDDGCQKS